MLIPWNFKKALWDEAMSATGGGSGSVPTRVDRFKAFRLQQQGRCDTKAKATCFAQLFRQLDAKDCFRLTRDARFCTVAFAGEYSIDAGGPFRELITMMCAELQSGDLPLFMPSPNNRSEVGHDQERFLPVPASGSKPLCLQLYEFLGKLMGMSMRTGYFLNLDLSSMVWKPLVLDQVTLDDVRSADSLFAQILTEVRTACAGQDDNTELKESFEASRLTFSVVGSDQKEHKLGHNSGLVTWEKRHKYLHLLEQYRFNSEFKEQTAAIRRGLATVVPYAVLSLFTWEELESEVVGVKTIDVDYLEANTEYSGCSSSDAHIRFFWAVMRTRFDDAQRAQLLRFVWGRSRLPLPGTPWERKFKIAAHSKSNQNSANVNNYLPDTHTCFFTLDLPRYTSMETLYNKMLYAIVNCVSVDGDGSLNSGGADMNADDSDNE
jgi:hypothetical protein